MGQATRVDDAVARLLTRIRADEFGAGPLPREADLAEETHVSRATLREAVKVLQALGVLRVEQGRGTFANPITSWESLDLLATPGPHGSREELAVQLIQVRRMIEVGAIGLFVEHCDDHDVAALRSHLQAMTQADRAGDVAEFVRHDLAFHDVILTGCGNLFVPLLMRPIARHLADARRQTSSVPQIRVHALAHHAAILDALERRDRSASTDAMRDHLQQTDDDLRRRVLAEPTE